MPGIEEAQGAAFRARTPFRRGVHAGQRVASLVKGPQHIGRVPDVAVTDEVLLGLLVRVQRSLVVGEKPRVARMVPRHEGMPCKRLSEGGDLRIDPSELVVASTSPEETGQRTYYSVGHAVIVVAPVGRGANFRRRSPSSAPSDRRRNAGRSTQADHSV
ncbi:hypothetical protein AB0G71_07505 [Streptomyces sp. NPDC020403]|uniref:hypothetical protein n=1 Tax=unclassified Streptomyces TaxID=2593676 RepID=UPI0033D698B7